MITQKKLKELLFYDPDTGLFVWLVDAARNVKAGSVAGTLQSNGYIYIRINGIGYRAHRLVWLCVYGYYPIEIDHENRIRHENNLDNLREATRLDNSRNRELVATNTTGYRGVSFHKGAQKYDASIRVRGKTIHLGLFGTAKAASAEREIAAYRYFGEYNPGGK